MNEIDCGFTHTTLCSQSFLPHTHMPSPTKSGMSGNSSHVGGSVKQQKMERKAKEQRLETLQAMSDRIGKLEDRDTQQQAFQALVCVLPN